MDRWNAETWNEPSTYRTERTAKHGLCERANGYWRLHVMDRLVGAHGERRRRRAAVEMRTQLYHYSTQTPAPRYTSTRMTHKNDNRNCESTWNLLRAVPTCTRGCLLTELSTFIKNSDSLKNCMLNLYLELIRFFF